MVSAPPSLTFHAPSSSFSGSTDAHGGFYQLDHSPPHPKRACDLSPLGGSEMECLGKPPKPSGAQYPYL